MESTFDVALLLWPRGVGVGRAQLLGIINDAETVEFVRKRLAVQRRRELARLEQPVRLVPDPDTEDEAAAAEPKNSLTPITKPKRET